MKEIQYSVLLTHKKSGNKLRLQVWAENGSRATAQFAGVLLGPDREYVWRGTEPEHDAAGNVIMREVSGE